MKQNKDLAYMNELFEAGKLVPVIDRVYKLADVPEAFRLFGAGDQKGKIIVTMRARSYIGATAAARPHCAAHRPHPSAATYARDAYCLSYTTTLWIFCPSALVPVVVDVRDLPSGATTMWVVVSTLPFNLFST